MKKINTLEMAEESWTSPKGKFAIADKNISIALGRDPESTDIMKRHPFDVEICRIPAGKTACPFHSHSAEWEFYSRDFRQGLRSRPGRRDAGLGGCLHLRARQPGTSCAATPRATSCSTSWRTTRSESPATTRTAAKWLVRSPERALIRSEPLDYHETAEANSPGTWGDPSCEGLGRLTGFAPGDFLRGGRTDPRKACRHPSGSVPRLGYPSPACPPHPPPP